jgi:hypothetical protein
MNHRLIIILLSLVVIKTQLNAASAFICCTGSANYPRFTSSIFGLSINYQTSGTRCLAYKINNFKLGGGVASLTISVTAGGQIAQYVYLTGDDHVVADQNFLTVGPITDWYFNPSTDGTNWSFQMIDKFASCTGFLPNTICYYEIILAEMSNCVRGIQYKTERVIQPIDILISQPIGISNSTLSTTIQNDTLHVYFDNVPNVVVVGTPTVQINGVVNTTISNTPNIKVEGAVNFAIVNSSPTLDVYRIVVINNTLFFKTDINYLQCITIQTTGKVFSLHTYQDAILYEIALGTLTTEIEIFTISGTKTYLNYSAVKILGYHFNDLYGLQARVCVRLVDNIQFLDHTIISIFRVE